MGGTPHGSAGWVPRWSCGCTARREMVAKGQPKVVGVPRGLGSREGARGCRHLGRDLPAAMAQGGLFLP